MAQPLLGQDLPCRPCRHIFLDFSNFPVALGELLGGTSAAGSARPAPAAVEPPHSGTAHPPRGLSPSQGGRIRQTYAAGSRASARPSARTQALWPARSRPRSHAARTLRRAGSRSLAAYVAKASAEDPPSRRLRVPAGDEAARPGRRRGPGPTERATRAPPGFPRARPVTQEQVDARVKVTQEQDPSRLGALRVGA